MIVRRVGSVTDAARTRPAIASKSFAAKYPSSRYTAMRSVNASAVGSGWNCVA